MKASRIAAVGALAGSAVLVLSGPAFAHVSVAAEGAAAKGGYATVNFKVPNERDDATTTKLEVNFPLDHPLASVMPAPVDGWKIQVTKSKFDGLGELLVGCYAGYLRRQITGVLDDQLDTTEPLGELLCL